MTAGGADVQMPSSLPFVINNFGSMNNIQTADNVNLGTNNGDISQRALDKKRTTYLPMGKSGVTVGKPTVSKVAQLEGGLGQKSVLQFGVLSLLNLLRTNFPLALPPKRQDNESKESVQSAPMASSSASSAEESDVEMIAMDVDHPTPPEPALHDIYVRTLLCKGHGLPCWQPSPDKPTTQPKGVIPGDVGTYSVKSGFKKNFNLWDDDAMVQEKSKRWNKGSTCPIPDRDIETRFDALQMGEALFNGVRVSQGSALEDVEYSFSCRFAPGAILALTSSADEEESERIVELEKYIIHHAKAIYKHASGIRPLGVKESLYIVTGCTKSDSWAMAVYTECEPGQSVLQLVPERGSGDGEPSGYRWTSQDLGSSRLRRSIRGPQPRAKDQALFLQGFKLAFSPRFRSQMDNDDFGDDDSGSTTDGSEDGADDDDDAYEPDQADESDEFYNPDELDEPDEHQDPDEPADPGRHPDASKDRSLPPDEGSHSSSGQSSNLGLSLGSLTPGLNVDEDVRCSSFPDITQVSYHPSDDINAYLLRQTGCEVAITHDDSWRLLFKLNSTPDGQGSMGPGEDMRILQEDAGRRTFCVQNDVAFILPTDGNSCETTLDARSGVPVIPPAATAVGSDSEQGNSSKKCVKNPKTRRNKGRVTTGCYTCRIRRKKCDEERTESDRCRTCARLRIECLGFGAKRPEWLRESRKVAAIRKDIKDFLSVSKKRHANSGPRSNDDQVLALSTVSVPLDDKNTTVLPANTEEPAWFSLDRANIETPSEFHRARSPSPSSTMANFESSGGGGPYDLGMGSDFGNESVYGSYFHSGFEYQAGSNIADNAMVPDMIWESFQNQDNSQNALSLRALVSSPGMCIPRPAPTMGNSEDSDNTTAAPIRAITTPSGTRAPLPGILGNPTVGHWEDPDFTIAAPLASSPWMPIELPALLEHLTKGNSEDPDNAIAALRGASMPFSGGVCGIRLSLLQLATRYVGKVLQNQMYDHPRDVLLHASWKDGFIVKTCIWFDVLASVTTRRPPQLLDEVRSMFSPTSSGIYDQSFDASTQCSMMSPMGCQNRIVWALAETSTLAAWKDEEKECGRLSIADLTEKAAEIERQVEDHHREGGLGVNLYRSSLRDLSMGQDLDEGHQLKEAQIIASEIFKCSTKLFLAAVVGDDRPQAQAVQDGINQVLKCYRNIFERGHGSDVHRVSSSVVRSTTFAIYLAGSLSISSEHREELVGYLDTDSAGWNSGAMGRCTSIREALHELWRTTAKDPDAPVPWRQLLKERDILLI